MDIDEKCVNELRVLSNELITNAKSGHPGIALGSAPIIYSLYANVLAVDGKDDKNISKDHFVLSAGHGSALLYSILYAMGYDISVDDLKNFRKLGSKTPGHPEFGVTPGVDCSTGPLGQGVANAVGLAMVKKYFGAKFNKPDQKLIDSQVFCMVGDGCLMEGISYEALSLAGNLKLDNFVLIYDRNKITIEGKTDITFTDDIKKRFESINFKVFEVKDGNNTKAITNALLKAKKCKKPSIVVVNTTIGYGSELAGNQKIHGSPLSAEALNCLKIKLDVNKPIFDLSNDVKAHFTQKIEDAKNRLKSQDYIEEYKGKYPVEYNRLLEYFDNQVLQNRISKIKEIEVKDVKMATTRDINHIILNQVAQIIPNLFGGSADVATSTKAYVEHETAFSAKHFDSNFVHFGIREHAMAGICNGIALFGGIIPYLSCFLSFFDYLKPSLRMSALMGLRMLYTFSHDSLTAGQDGPTHQPIEQLPSLRLIPNTIVSRPYNASEVIATYVWLLKNQKPVCMLVSKDAMDYVASSVDGALKGGYVLSENKQAQITIISTGSDVDRCLKAKQILAKSGILSRVVSMPCVAIFNEQSGTYRNKVLGNLPKVFVEASAENCWYKMANATDLIINFCDFGKSGSAGDVLKYAKLDEKSIALKIKNWLKKQTNQTK
jgi:transketolase